VVATVVEPPDASSAPAANVLGQIHCNLTIEYRWLGVAFDPCRTQVCRHDGIDLSE
jgi:hypothetical protein